MAACGIIGKQIFGVWDFIFTNKCDNCRGTGRMICRNCRGTKTLRKRPGEFHLVKSDLADQAADDVYALIFAALSSSGLAVVCCCFGLTVVGSHEKVLDICIVPTMFLPSMHFSTGVLSMVLPDQAPTSVLLDRFI